MSAARKKAIKLYTEFHGFDPVETGDLHPGFRIPITAYCVGRAKTMFYSSDKLNPETREDEGWISYYHEHGNGARMYLTNSKNGGEIRDVPRKIYQAKVLWCIGDCEGFEYEALDGEKVEAEGSKPLPEWYAVPSGKALLVVQDKRRVLALVWGGDLHVEWRGVVG